MLVQEQRDMARRKELRRSQTAKGCLPSSPAACPSPAQASCSLSSVSAAPAADLLPSSSASAARTIPFFPLLAAAVAQPVLSAPTSSASVAAKSLLSSSSAVSPVTVPALPCVSTAATTSTSIAVAHRVAAGVPATTSSSPAAAAADLNTFTPSFSVVAASEPLPLQHTGIDTACTGHAPDPDPASAFGVFRPAIAPAFAVSKTDTPDLPHVSPSEVVATPAQMPTSQIAASGSASHDELQSVLPSDVKEDHLVSLGCLVSWEAKSHPNMVLARPGSHERSHAGLQTPKADSSSGSLASYRLPDTPDHDSSD